MSVSGRLSSEVHRDKSDKFKWQVWDGGIPRAWVRSIHWHTHNTVWVMHLHTHTHTQTHSPSSPINTLIQLSLIKMIPDLLSLSRLRVTCIAYSLDPGFSLCALKINVWELRSGSKIEPVLGPDTQSYMNFTASFIDSGNTSLKTSMVLIQQIFYWNSLWDGSCTIKIWLQSYTVVQTTEYRRF